jgi:hypothetical protein
MKRILSKHLKSIKMKNKITDFFEVLGYLIGIVICSGLVYWAVKFAYYVVTSIYNVLTR